MGKQSVVITGGSQGIGLSITESFLNAGYKVIVGARNYSESLGCLDGDVEFVAVDVRYESSHQELVERATSDSYELRTYINNAGVSGWKAIKGIDEEFFSRLVDINLKGAFWGCKAATEKLCEGGSIINISSIAGKRGSANNSAYVATKFGMNGLTQSLAKELGPEGIRVNAICPVLIATQGLIDALQDEDSPADSDIDDFFETFRKENTALGRLPIGAEIGDVAVFLASNNASAITGQCINVDCGVFPQ